MMKKLLLADDSITIQKVVGIIFSKEEYQLEITDDGDLAFNKALAEVPDLVIADISMPGKNGFELCRAIKNEPLLSNTSVLLLPGTFDHFEEAKAEEVCADGWLTKPFESQALLDKVAQLLAAEPVRMATMVELEEPVAEELDIDVVVSDEVVAAGPIVGVTVTEPPVVEPPVVEPPVVEPPVVEPPVVEPPVVEPPVVEPPVVEELVTEEPVTIKEPIITIAKSIAVAPSVDEVALGLDNVDELAVSAGEMLEEESPEDIWDAVSFEEEDLEGQSVMPDIDSGEDTPFTADVIGSEAAGALLGASATVTEVAFTATESEPASLDELQPTPLDDGDVEAGYADDLDAQIESDSELFSSFTADDTNVVDFSVVSEAEDVLPESVADMSTETTYFIEDTEDEEPLKLDVTVDEGTVVEPETAVVERAVDFQMGLQEKDEADESKRVHRESIADVEPYDEIEEESVSVAVESLEFMDEDPVEQEAETAKNESGVIFEGPDDDFVMELQEEEELEELEPELDDSNLETAEKELPSDVDEDREEPLSAEAIAALEATSLFSETEAVELVELAAPEEKIIELSAADLEPDEMPITTTEENGDFSFDDGAEADDANDGAEEESGVADALTALAEEKGEFSFDDSAEIDDVDDDVEEEIGIADAFAALAEEKGEFSFDDSVEIDDVDDDAEEEIGVADAFAALAEEKGEFSFDDSAEADDADDDAGEEIDVADAFAALAEERGEFSFDDSAEADDADDDVEEEIGVADAFAALAEEKGEFSFDDSAEADDADDDAGEEIDVADAFAAFAEEKGGFYFDDSTETDDAGDDAGEEIGVADAFAAFAEEKGGFYFDDSAEEDDAAEDGDDEVDVAEEISATERIEQQLSQLSEDELTEIVARVAGPMIEKMAVEMIERIAWEVVPDLAEVKISEEIRKIKEGA